MLDNQPTIDGDLCIHDLSPLAQCRACVQACPQQAFELDKGALLLDENICDGCGLCVDACPQQAITVTDIAPPMREDRAGVFAFLACEKARCAPENTIACVHSVGLFGLMALYSHKARLLYVATGDCKTCVRKPKQGLLEHLDGFNLLLKSRNAASMTLELLSASLWQKRFDSMDSFSPENQSRRNFLRRAVSAALIEDEEDLEKGMFSSLPPFPKDIAPEDKIYPFAPSLAPSRCIGCHACSMICPHKAIVLAHEREGLFYALKAGLCNGCGLCQDVCDQDAITITALSAQKQTRLKLSIKQCTACGAAYHLPETIVSEGTLCPICEKTNHHKNLFQIIDD